MKVRFQDLDISENFYFTDEPDKRYRKLAGRVAGLVGADGKLVWDNGFVTVGVSPNEEVVRV